MGPGPAWLDPIWMLVKIMVLILVFIWVRATVPRLRYDQLMSLGWKMLLPLATLNVLVTAVLVTVTCDGSPTLNTEQDRLDAVPLPRLGRRDLGPARARARRRRRRATAPSARRCGACGPPSAACSRAR